MLRLNLGLLTCEVHAHPLSYTYHSQSWTVTCYSHAYFILHSLNFHDNTTTEKEGIDHSRSSLLRRPILKLLLYNLVHITSFACLLIINLANFYFTVVRTTKGSITFGLLKTCLKPNRQLRATTLKTLLDF